MMESLISVMDCIEDECFRHPRRVGRPMIKTEEEQIKFLLERGFRVKDVALLIGCSKRTIERRLHDFNLSSRSYTAITNTDLDGLVKEIASCFPRCGEKLTQARLRSQGINVQRWRVRECIKRVDISGIHSRMSRVLRRRAYEVSSPNAVWHVDTYHKLIRLPFYVLLQTIKVGQCSRPFVML